MTTKIALVNGSLRSRSVCSVALNFLEELILASSGGVEVIRIDLNDVALPLMNPESPRPPIYSDLKTKVESASGIVLFSPDYHGCMSGTLKNFLDYFWKEFAGKTFGYVCSSHEKGLTAMDQMRTAVRQCYGWSLPYGVSLNEKDLDEPQQKILAPAVIQRMGHLAHDITVYSRLLHEQFEKERTSGFTSGFATHYRRQ